MELLQNWLSWTLFSTADYQLTLGDLLQALLVLVAGYWLSNLLRSALSRSAFVKNNISPSALYALQRSIHYLVMVLAVGLALSAMGFNVDKMLILAGALGVGIGFGLQNIVNNFISGIIILYERSIKVGDLLELESGVFGEVTEINIRSTLIKTGDNIEIIIPNSELINARVTNWTLRDALRRFRIPFGVAYGTDKTLLKRTVMDAISQLEYTYDDGAERRPDLWMTGFGESSLDFELVVWVSPEGVKRPGSIKSAYLWAIDDALAKVGIEIPFPQRDLHIRSAQALDGELLARLSSVTQSRQG